MKGLGVTAVSMTNPIENPLRRQRALAEYAPIRLRATITIDIEGHDHLDAQQAKAAIEARFTEIRRDYETADLEFRQRKPRVNRRPPAPGPVIAPYADD